MSRTRREGHIVRYSLAKVRRNFRALVRSGLRLDWVSLDAERLIAERLIRAAAGHDREWPPVALKPARRRAGRRR
jgi:hypothetical protein